MSVPFISSPNPIPNHFADAGACIVAKISGPSPDDWTPGMVRAIQMPSEEQ